MGLVGDMELRDDVVGPAGTVESLWDKGEAVPAGLEGEDHAVLDCLYDGCGGRLRDDGLAEGSLS